ncbi:unnamed protein product, partial [Rotaria magnacalcarata]
TRPVSARPRLPINVCTGDLIKQNTDVIVVCSSSKYLFESICEAGGDLMSTTYKQQIRENPNATIITIAAGGKLPSLRVYFLSWQPDTDESILCKSIEEFVSTALEQASNQNYRSISFPAIGCGQFGCSIELVARTMVQTVYSRLKTYQMSVTFVIQPDKTDIYDEFKKHIDLLETRLAPTKAGVISARCGTGEITVEMADITIQKVDVIIASSSSAILQKAILDAAGEESQRAYDKELKTHPNATLFTLPSGTLPCKKIFLVTWMPDKDEKVLQRSVTDLIYTVVLNTQQHNFTSIALPAIGCGKIGCSMEIVVKTMVHAMKANLMERSLPWKVKFVVETTQAKVYEEFCKQLLTKIT